MKSSEIIQMKTLGLPQLWSANMLLEGFCFQRGWGICMSIIFVKFFFPPTVYMYVYAIFPPIKNLFNHPDVLYETFWNQISVCRNKSRCFLGGALALGCLRSGGRWTYHYTGSSPLCFYRLISSPPGSTGVDSSPPLVTQTATTWDYLESVKRQ